MFLYKSAWKFLFNMQNTYKMCQTQSNTSNHPNDTVKWEVVNKASLPKECYLFKHKLFLLTDNIKETEV